MKYDWILFDADETLFHFDAFAGLERMFATKGVRFTRDDFAEYQLVNLPLWKAYQDGEINAEQLKQRRFDSWAQRLATSTQELNDGFLEAMADICTPLPGARELLAALQGKVKLGIITNGFTELQQVRLERTGLLNVFEHVIISEQVGIAKPDAGIFRHTWDKIGQPEKSRMLMVGDSLQSDILGGLNFGIETCWLNRHEADSEEGILPHYTVTSLCELQAILFA